LGGVGVWNVARVFVEQKRKTIAVLKCLGAGGTQVIAVYLMQILTLGLIGSLFGVLLAQIFLWFARWRFADAFARSDELRRAFFDGVARRSARRFNFSFFFSALRCFKFGR
jgi:predicted lysophospholipase L1 biosynthesis ABC-type transport system permease subunit